MMVYELVALAIGLSIPAIVIIASFRPLGESKEDKLKRRDRYDLREIDSGVKLGSKSDFEYSLTKIRKDADITTKQLLELHRLVEKYDREVNKPAGVM